jgi:hypothetical protein
MTLGAPPKYDAADIAQGVVAYTNLCKAQFYLPTIEGLAVHLCVARQTLYDWANPSSAHYHPEFAELKEQLLALQASMLIQNGLKNEYNASITKLMLTKHGYADRQELTGVDGSKLFNDAEAKAKGKRAIGKYLGNPSDGE